MSKICLFVLPQARGRYYEIVSQIDPLLRKNGIFSFWNITYEEPIFERIDISDSIILSVADDLYNNCDYLLLPDNCSINGRKNRIPFFKRMRIIQDVLQELSKYCSSIELFIADSGCGYDEYEECQLDICDFEDYSNCLNSLSPPDMHFVFIPQDERDKGTVLRDKGTVL